MNSFRQTNKRTLLLWSLLLSLALLCAQGVKLHVHDLGHGHDEYHNHSVNEAVDHGYLNKAHFAHDTSHHHDGFAVDVSLDELLKNTHNNVLAIALFTFFFTFITFVSSRQLVQRCRESKLALHSYYVLSPPLRAPPLH